MNCTKCWYINERDNPYKKDVYGELSKEDIKEFDDIINTMEHDLDCDKKDKK